MVQIIRSGWRFWEMAGWFGTESLYGICVVPSLWQKVIGDVMYVRDDCRVRCQIERYSRWIWHLFSDSILK